MAASKQRIPYFIEPLFTFKKPNYKLIEQLILSCSAKKSSLQKKCSFRLRISSVNVIKSTVSSISKHL